VGAEELLVRQSEDIMKATGSTALIDVNSKGIHRMCAIVRAEEDSTVLRSKLEAAADSLAVQFAAADPTSIEMTKQTLKRSVEMVSTPWFRYLLTLKPADTLRQVKQPVLALNGSLDLQVDAKQNLPVIEKALRDGGNKDVTVEELPGLNHLFQTATTGSPMEYATIEETMSPVAMKKISDWILARTSAKKK